MEERKTRSSSTKILIEDGFNYEGIEAARVEGIINVPLTIAWHTVSKFLDLSWRNSLY